MPQEIFESCVRTSGDLAGVFEHDGESGWFYLYAVKDDGGKVLAATWVHAGLADYEKSDILVRWAQSEEKFGLYIRGMLWSVFDIQNNKAYGCEYALDKLPQLPSEATLAFEAGYRCGTCGAWHPERPTCFGFEMPIVVSQLSPEDRERRVELSSDQCVLDDEHFFILGTLDLPVQGSDEVLRWTAWSTLSGANFERASELWNVEGREREPPYFGWLSNRIPGFPDTLHLQLQVHTEPFGTRPRLEVVSEGHPLRHAQRDGITQAKADELIHLALDGNDGPDSNEPAA